LAKIGHVSSRKIEGERKVFQRLSYSFSEF
jgi:hypothetical protein